MNILLASLHLRALALVLASIHSAYSPPTLYNKYTHTHTHTYYILILINARARIKVLMQPFSRGVGLEEGALVLNSNRDPLLFFCDVDMKFNSDFLHRCRMNAVPGKRMYFPIVFSLYRNKVRISERVRERERESVCVCVCVCVYECV